MFKSSHVAIFWNDFFFAWWAQITSENIHLPDSAHLYGPVNSSKHNQEISLALLVAKYFIYITTLQFREIILTERHIAMDWKELMIIEW